MTLVEPPVADRWALVPAPVGDLVLTGTGSILTGCWFTRGRHALVARDDLVRDDDAFAAAADQLDEYFAGDREAFELELAPSGTPFQLRVWDLLRQIPYGTTRSYGQLAVELGTPGASRAVGLANGRNPISIIVPCHRVIGADGRLTGFGGGIDNKRLLLDLEAGTLPFG